MPTAAWFLGEVLSWAIRMSGLFVFAVVCLGFAQPRLLWEGFPLAVYLAVAATALAIGVTLATFVFFVTTSSLSPPERGMWSTQLFLYGPLGAARFLGRHGRGA